MDVIYVTPILLEKHLDVGEFLRHEITHAIIGNNASWWKLPRMKHVSWLYEGVPVWFGRQHSYVTQEEFMAGARTMDLHPVIGFDSVSNDSGKVNMRFYVSAGIK